MDRKPFIEPSFKYPSSRVSDLIVILILGAVFFLYAAQNDCLERIYRFSRAHEDWELDEIITVSFFFTLALMFYSVRRWREIHRSEKELKRLLQKQKEAMEEIRRLRGIIPICASCKKIRDDSGYWHQVESYIRQHSEAEFSHGICPECAKKFYPELDLPEPLADHQQDSVDPTKPL